MQEFYQSRQIVMFKDSISVPGVTRRLLFRETECVFPLFDTDTQDIFKTISNCAVGGPSIVFTRHMKANETWLRGNAATVCKTIIGKDMNSLYLSTLNEKFPTGVFVDRRRETNYMPKPAIRFLSQCFWVDYVSKSNNNKDKTQTKQW